MKKLIFSLMFVMASQAAHAGNEGGNGGGGWVCRDADSKILWTKLVDTFEGREEHELVIHEDPVTPFELQLADLEKRILKANPKFYLDLMPRLAKVRALVRIKSSVGMAVIDDAKYRVTPAPESCAGGTLRYEQAAAYVEYPELKKTVITVNQQIWNALSETDKAALYLHEAIYLLFREIFKETDSVRTRLASAILLAGVPTSDYPGLFGSYAWSNAGDRCYDFVIPPQFEDVRDFKNGLAPAMQGKKWGIVDKFGKFVVTPRFDHIEYGFSGEAVIMQQDQKWGIIDLSGNWVVDPKYPAIRGFSKVYEPHILLPDHALIYQDASPDSWVGAADRSGKIIVPIARQSASDVLRKLGIAVPGDTESLPGNLVRFSVKKLYGYKDHAGRVVVKPQFRAATQFSEGRAFVGSVATLIDSMIDNEGRVTQLNYVPFTIPHEKMRSRTVMPFKNGYAFVAANEGDGLTFNQYYSGFIDRNGQPVGAEGVTGFIGYELDPGKNHPAASSQGKGAGFVNGRGDYVFGPFLGIGSFEGFERTVSRMGNQFNNFATFASRLWSGRELGQEHKWGVIDMNGGVVVPPQFLEMKDATQDGLIPVMVRSRHDKKSERKWGLIQVDLACGSP